jgi:hypothetical protein
MKKKLLTLALALVMCLSLVPMTAFAADFPAELDAPTISDLSVYYQDSNAEAGVQFKVVWPDSLKAAISYYQDTGLGLSLWGEISVDGGDYIELNVDSGEMYYPDEFLAKDGQTVKSLTSANINAESVIKYRVRLTGEDDVHGRWYSPWSNVLTLNEKVDIGNTSDWATGEIEKAAELGLIPDSLQGQDLTKPITRAEFAAVSVKVYENLSGTAAIPAVNNPFTDTTDVEVLKAYNVGITTGTAADKFSPNELLNREQAATMLTRVFKKVSLAGWTIQTDAQFTLPYEKPAAFADDAKISDWAKDSVYFMAAHSIINGVGNNNFAPRATTAAEEAQNYASATREQALAIAVRMVENLK